MKCNNVNRNLTYCERIKILHAAKKHRLDICRDLVSKIVLNYSGKVYCESKSFANLSFRVFCFKCCDSYHWFVLEYRLPTVILLVNDNV
jgi:hypothetical protein